MVCALSAQVRIAHAVCPTGAYETGGNCVVCPAGSSCTTTAATPCAGAGSYSLKGEMTCSTCPPGYACSSAGTTPAQCTWGEFAAGSATSCTACTASSQEVCSLSTTETCNVVTNREFADQTANYVCHEIPRGHDLTANSLVPCAVGQHFNVANTCSDCGPNKYCPTKTANIMLTCPAGTYNTAGG